MELEIEGKIVKRVFNEKVRTQGGIRYSVDYLVVKPAPRDTNKGLKQDFFSLEYFSSNVTTGLLEQVKEGYVVKCTCRLECVPFEGEVELNTITMKNGVTRTSPKLFPKLVLVDIEVIMADDMESRKEANKGFEEEFGL